MEVAADRRAIRSSRCTSGSLRELQQVPFAVQDAPDQAVQQRVTLGIAMAHHKADQRRHPPRQSANGGRWTGQRLAEQISAVARGEDDSLRRHRIRHEGPHRPAKPVEIGTLRQRHAARHAVR